MANIKVKVIGGERLRRKFLVLPARAAKHLRDAVAISADQVKTEIQRSMRSPKTGRVYTWRIDTRAEDPDLWVMVGGRFLPAVLRNKPHRASAPGEAPAVDTGLLRSSIKVKRGDAGLTAWIGVQDVTNIKYAVFLEFGTQSMKARPFVLPAFELHKKTMRNRMRRAVRAAQNEISKR